MTDSVPLETSESGVRFAACYGRVGGAGECVKQAWASSGLISDGLSRYDPEYLLTAQAQDEGLAQKHDPARVFCRLRARI